jgi:hypothetical protein
MNPIQEAHRNFLFARNVELVDYQNNLGTNNGESFILCFLTDGPKGRKFVNKKRIFCAEIAADKFVESPRNEYSVAELTQNMNSQSICQVQTIYLAVSMDYHIELFNFQMTLIRKIPTNTPFQFMVPVIRQDLALEMSESIIQGSYIGYNYGSLFKCEIAALA